MSLKVRIFAALIALVMVCGCSREGFEESLNRKDDAKGGKSAAAQSDPADAEDFIFDLNTEEYEEDNRLYCYATPIAASSKAEKAAEKIADSIKKVIENVADEVADGREYEQFALYDAVTLNNGEIFSVIYEMELVSRDGDDEEYFIGLVFNAQTGKRMELEELMKPSTFITLVLDEQSSKIPGRKEEVVAQKRAYLNEQGEKDLTKRLTNSQSEDMPLDASYYIDGNNLVAVFSALKELGDVIEVSVPL